MRRTRDGFRENLRLTDPKAIAQLMEFGKRNLEVIRRQALIGRLYDHQDLVVEMYKKAGKH